MIFSHHHLYKSWNMNLNSILSEKKRFVKGQKRKREKNLRAERREDGRVSEKNGKSIKTSAKPVKSLDKSVWLRLK